MSKSQNSKDLVKRLTQKRKVEQTEDEDIAEIQDTNQKYVRFLKIGLAIELLIFLATVIGLIIIGIKVTSIGDTTQLIDNEDDRFSAEVAELRRDYDTTKLSVESYINGEVEYNITVAERAALNTTKNYTYYQTLIDDVVQNLTKLENDLTSVDYTDSSKTFFNYYDQYHATFVGNGCHFDCTGNSTSPDSKNNNIDDCLASCYKHANGTLTGWNGITYKGDTRECWCNGNSKNYIKINGHVYYRYNSIDY